jgi:hypothetical protein
MVGFVETFILFLENVPVHSWRGREVVIRVEEEEITGRMF